MNAFILSAALDTNGQNARFVRAAEKWGDDDTILRVLALGNDDPAGVVGRYQLATEKLGGLRIRSAHRAAHYFEFPGDLVWDRKTEPQIRQLVMEADIVHLNNSYRAVQRFGIRKPMLLHHHGSMFRNNPEHMLGVAKHYRMLQAVSTIDLTRPDPKVLHWLPTAYDVDDLVKFGQEHRREPDGRIRIVHAPTNRMLKHTDMLITVIRELVLEGLPIDLELVENRTWAETMTRKAAADIVFDQLMFGYGCNSVEAWAMNVPVIAGADDWTLAAMRKAWGGLPFVEATEGTLKDVIRQMVTSAEMRQEAIETGHAHVRKYHDERPALAKLAELYREAIKHYTSRRIPGKGAKPVTFRSTKGRKVYDVDGQPIAFDKGEVRTADPIVIQRLRYFVTKRPMFGIVEVA